MYEFVSGGGWHSASADPPPPSLLAEGQAMVRALVSDFAAIPGAEVHTLRDWRLPEVGLPGCRIHQTHSAADEEQLLTKLAAEVDWTILIAPEFGGLLLDRCRRVEAAGGRLLGPNAEVVALASDKQRTIEYLARHGIRVPYGRLMAPREALPPDFPYPAVLKPNDGAGSQGIRLVSNAKAPPVAHTVPHRLEQFRPGLAASVSLLCGPGRRLALPACRQLLSDDGTFQYLGGALPLASALAQRATRLASEAVAALPSPLGYLGVDLVLGPDPLGHDDVIIEINPRLTTSYVGLRAAASVNLAEAMLAVANGQDAALQFADAPVRFDPDGRVYRTFDGGAADQS